MLGGWDRGQAITVNFGALAATITQPSSQYFHYAYGGYIAIASDKDTVVARISYLERPVFSSAGFSDQDSYGQLAFGGQVGQWGSLRVNSLVGLGQVYGYLISSQDDESRSYSLRGLSLLAEAGWSFEQMSIYFGHDLFVGRGSAEHTEAFVFWPYTVFYFRLGMRI